MEGKMGEREGERGKRGERKNGKGQGYEGGE